MSVHSISAVVVWPDGSASPEATLRSLLEQTEPVGEVVALVEATRDMVPCHLGRAFGTHVKICCAPGPLADGRGWNLGLQLVSGDLVLLVAPGVVLDPSFVAEALLAFDDPRTGLVTGRLLADPDRPGGRAAAGVFLSRSREPLEADLAGGPRRAVRVLAPPVGATIIRRAMLEDIADEPGPFDPALGAPLAVLEFGWRAWRAGWRCVAAPGAVAERKREEPGGGRGAADPLGALIATVRGRHATMLRHDSLRSLLLDSPFVLVRELALALRVGALSPSALVTEVWDGGLTYARARERRRADAARRGAWGSWSRDVPPRGVWREDR